MVLPEGRQMQYIRTTPIQRQTRSCCSCCWSRLGSVDCGWEGQSIANTEAILTQGKHSHASRVLLILMLTASGTQVAWERIILLLLRAVYLHIHVRLQCTERGVTFASGHVDDLYSSCLAGYMVYFGSALPCFLLRHSSSASSLILDHKLLSLKQPHWNLEHLWSLIYKQALVFRWLTIRWMWHLSKALCLLPSHCFQQLEALGFASCLDLRVDRGPSASLLLCIVSNSVICIAWASVTQFLLYSVHTCPFLTVLTVSCNGVLIQVYIHLKSNSSRTDV